MSEILNLEAIEQQRILITVSLTGSDGAPVNPSDYVICAAAIGQPNPYTQRAVRKEWAASINNENSAFLLTCPGLDMAGAPWKYRILLKNRALELEWQIVSGRISLTPRACGTDGISPAAYSVACEATPSGLVNVTLDATVGSISTTLEQVKASAALASTSAANAHADLEDARKAATTAAQAATTAAADAKTAAEAATRAEQAATDAPQACAPFVGQVQAAAVQAQQAATHAEEDANRASTAATTATEKAKIATDAAEEATTASSDLASARDTAVQASTTATTAAENAREYAEDAEQAKQAAATSGSNAATAAQQASDSASAAAASAATAQASAATAVSAKSDLETARDTATAAATTATDAATAAATSETNATAAATAAATAQAAAEAAQAQADTDARACAIYDQRVAANATAAADSATAAADSATAAADSATAAADSATAAADSATAAADSAASIDVFAIAAQIAAGTASMADGIIMSGAKGDNTTTICAVKNYQSSVAICDYLIIHGETFAANGRKVNKCLFSDTCNTFPSPFEGVLLGNECFVHVPNLEKSGYCFKGCGKILTFSSATKFDHAVDTSWMFQQTYGIPQKVNWAPGTTFSSLTKAAGMFYCSKAVYSDTSFLLTDNLPDTITFESLVIANDMFVASGVKALPKAMVLKSLTNGTGMFHGCQFLEIEDLVRVCLTINDLQALETPTTGSLGLPSSCKRNGETVDTQAYLNVNHPDFLTTLATKGWTVTFA